MTERVWVIGVVKEKRRGRHVSRGSLMADAPMGSLPVAILYAAFVEHTVASMTGAVKE